jgi:hypothetical protein
VQMIPGRSHPSVRIIFSSFLHLPGRGVLTKK